MALMLIFANLNMVSRVGPMSCNAIVVLMYVYPSITQPLAHIILCFPF